MEPCGAVVPALHAASVRRRPAKGGSIGEEDALITVPMGIGPVVGSVLLRKWDLIVAASTGSEWNGEGATLVGVL